MISKSMWEKYWTKKSKLDKVSNFYRIFILGWLIRVYAKILFEEDGMFVECGSGTGRASLKMKTLGKKLIGLDISINAVSIARKTKAHDFYVIGDVAHLPIKSEKVSGIWNFGVMEHFRIKKIEKIFLEFHRTLKKSGCCILFWPSFKNLVTFFFFFVYGIRAKLTFKDFFNPPYLLTNDKILEIKKVLKKIGFSYIVCSPSFFDGFCHYKLILKK